MDGPDEIDWKLLNLLQDNSRISYNDLAEALNMSQSGVYERVKRLRSKKIITKFTTLVDPKKVGKNVEAYVRLMIEPKESKNAVKKLVTATGVQRLYSITGDYNLLVYIVSEDMGSFNTLLEEISKIPGSKQHEVLMVLARLKDETKLHPG